VLDKHLDEKDYNEFKKFLELQCGIVLGESKQYLVKSRLSPLLTTFNMNSLSTLVKKTQNPAERQLRGAVIDAMTTNETLWFRDEYPFELLKKKLLPELANTKSSLKIWSAASSSGQEPYSIAMCVKEFLEEQKKAFPGGVQITGTDISTTMLENCKSGYYDGLALSRGLSDERKKRFFDSREDGIWQVKDSIKAMVKFRQLNLLTSYNLMGKFDLVFCRNVLIYFSPEIKKQILSQIHGVLNDNSYLFLGASESISALEQNFDMVRCNPGIIYQKQ
jgi:chemotaxis protein methyltransferase CheR